jgi:pSer/pThr/pTyr-binding forkhead associated (FHA) protein
LIVVTVGLEGQSARRFEFTQAEVTVGRADGCDLVLASPEVSGNHAALFLQQGKVIVRDLGSTNGTHVNGQALQRPMIVRPVDVVRVGPYLLQVEFSQPVAG